MVLTPDQVSANALTDSNGYGQSFSVAPNGAVTSAFAQPRFSAAGGVSQAQQVANLASIYGAPPAPTRDKWGQPIGSPPPSTVPKYTWINGQMVPVGSPAANTGAVTSRVNSILSQPSPADTAPTTMPKSAAQASLIAGANTDRTANAAANKQSLGDWLTDYLKAKPTVQANAGQEANAVGAVYDTGQNGMLAQLAAINRGQRSATNTQAQQALAQAGRRNSLLRMGSGNSAYADRTYGADAANIAAGAQQQYYNQGRSDYLTTLQAQQANLGRRNQVLQSALDFGLQPMSVRNQSEQANLGLDANLGGLEQSNVYQYDTPATRLARRQQLLDELNSYDTSSLR